MWKLGGLNVDGRVVLGPMSGFTTASYREFMKPFGVAAAVTEMTSDAGIINNHRETLGYLRFRPCPLTGLQLFGREPDTLAQAAAMAVAQNPNIDFIDFNMGCPVPKVVRAGAGSALLADPTRCGTIVRQIKKAVDLPVTAKIRLGRTLSDLTFRPVIAELEAAGADAIAVHARTASEHYAGIPHYDLVADLQREMSVPLVISGNVYALADAVHAIGTTGAAAVMVARGGVGNPFLVTQIDRWFRAGERLPYPTVNQQIAWCRQFAGMLIAEKGETIACRQLRSIAPHFVAGCHWSREYRRQLADELVDRTSLDRLLDAVSAEVGNQRIYAEGRPASAGGSGDDANSI